jgi:hypothetical protein
MRSPRFRDDKAAHVRLFVGERTFALVMTGFVPAIHVFLRLAKTWMPGIRPGMTW